MSSKLFRFIGLQLSERCGQLCHRFDGENNSSSDAGPAFIESDRFSSSAVPPNPVFLKNRQRYTVPSLLSTLLRVVHSYRVWRGV